MLEDQPALWTRDDARISTDRALVARHLPDAYDLLRVEHWGGLVTLELLERASHNSICFLALRGEQLIGFARVVTDLATFAYLTDVVIAPAARAQGIGQWLVQCILEHPQLQGLRRVSLLTRDAQTLYGKFGFSEGAGTQVYMEKKDA